MKPNHSWRCYLKIGQHSTESLFQIREYAKELGIDNSKIDIRTIHTLDELRALANTAITLPNQRSRSFQVLEDIVNRRESKKDLKPKSFTYEPTFPLVWAGTDDSRLKSYLISNGYLRIPHMDREKRK